MPKLNKNYINKLKLPHTNTLVIFNGVYQPTLSSKCKHWLFTKQNLKIFEHSKISAPLHLLFLTEQNNNCTINITVEENSSITLIEEHVSLTNYSYTNKININIIAKKNSEIIYYKLQTANNTTNHHAQTHITQKQSSKIISGFLGKGTKNSYDNLHVELTEKKACYNAYGILALRDTQNFHYQMRIDHLATNCTSNIIYKGIINHKATGTFDCLVVVHPNATKTTTHVTNKNLLLSEAATMNTSPQLEIYTDDVLCTHGATVGQLDQAALFYLRSRGIAKNRARQLLTTAFAQEITDQFADFCRTKTTLDIPYEY